MTPETAAPVRRPTHRRPVFLLGLAVGSFLLGGILSAGPGTNPGGRAFLRLLLGFVSAVSSGRLALDRRTRPGWRLAAAPILVVALLQTMLALLGFYLTAAWE